MRRMGLAVSVTLAGCLLGANPAASQHPGPNGGTDTIVTEKGIVGTISKDGKGFLSSEDHKSFSIINADMAKGYAGHKVSLTGKVNVEKDEIKILSIKDIAEPKK